MHCTSCGNTLPPNATICPTCGVPVAFPQGAAAGGNVYAPPPPSYQPGYGAAPANVPNYLVQSILVTLCCCLPFGIVAIVFAAQVNSKLAAGDVAGAMDASGKARMWCWIAFGVGILCSIGWFMANSAAFMRGFHQGLGR
jgi:hypothetical protein